MQQNYQCKQFTFSNNQENPLAALDCILAFIGEAVKSFGNCKNILLRSKWILTELFTNASKHSDGNVVRFEIKISNNVLQIIKSDRGQPFSLLVDNEIKTYPADFSEKETHLLHKDDLNILFAAVTDNSLIFSVADNIDVSNITVQEISEHFGLVIITKASDKFIYTYDNCNRTNIFTASLML